MGESGILPLIYESPSCFLPSFALYDDDGDDDDDDDGDDGDDDDDVRNTAA